MCDTLGIMDDMEQSGMLRLTQAVQVGKKLQRDKWVNFPCQRDLLQRRGQNERLSSKRLCKR